MRERFRILDARVPVERAEWIELWESWPAREVHAHPAYALLFADDADSVLCAVLAAPEGNVLYPVSLRPIELGTGEQYRDIVTPYGYGGAFCWGVGADTASRLSAEFWSAFDAWASTAGAVTEFVRFSLFPENLLEYPGTRTERLTNIVVDLERSEEDIWMGFEAKVRKNVKKAQRLSVRIVLDERGERLDEFLEIYHGTLDRRDATRGYYWERPFFESILSDLPGQFAFFHALVDDRIVSTEIVLVSSESVYSFLGGTRSDDFDLRPNDLLKYEIIRWARGAGKKHFVLGGGAAAGDGIERYKRSFAPNGMVQFLTGQRVLNPDAEAELVDALRVRVVDAGGVWDEGSGYFPRYRTPS